MKVSIQQFKSQLAKFIRESQSGKTLELTSHRKVVARVIGVPAVESVGVKRLLEAGIARWQGGKPKGAAISLSADGKPVSELIREERR